VLNATCFPTLRRFVSRPCSCGALPTGTRQRPPGGAVGRRPGSTAWESLPLQPESAFLWEPRLLPQPRMTCPGPPPPPTQMHHAREQKPSRTPKWHRKQMRSHPLFRDVLRQYALCKRPVLGPIPPLDASEEVLQGSCSAPCSVSGPPNSCPPPETGLSEPLTLKCHHCSPTT